LSGSPIRRLALAALALAGALPAAAAPAPGPPTAFALDHVSVIDVRTGAIDADRVVVVGAGHITAIAAAGAASPPPGALLLDAHGKFLIPGLWDMHVHVHAAPFLQLLLAEGITGVREMGGDPQTIGDWRARIDAGRMLGPRIIMAGLILDGPSPIWPAISRSVRTPADGHAAVVRAKREGSDFIKVYNGLSRDAYLAIVDEAKKQGMVVAGHVPLAITAAEASAAGQKSIEHLLGVLEGCTSDPHPAAMTRDHAWYLEHYDPALAESLAATFARNGTWQVPTLVVKRAFATIHELAASDDPRLRYIPDLLSARWDPSRDFRMAGRGPAGFADLRRVYDKDRELVGVLARAHVRILAGTDLGNPYIFPGFSLHDELQLLVGAGLTPLEALRAATLGPAEYLGATDSLGTVEPGKVADLVLLDANPLADITNVARISAVCARGALLGRASLDKLLADVAAEARSR